MALIFIFYKEEIENKFQNTMVHNTCIARNKNKHINKRKHTRHPTEIILI